MKIKDLYADKDLKDFKDFKDQIDLEADVPYDTRDGWGPCCTGCPQWGQPIKGCRFCPKGQSL